MNKAPVAILLLWAGLAVPAAAETYLCVGDSNTFGSGGGSTDAYLGPLGEYLAEIGQPGVFINAGRGGDNSVEALARFDDLLAAHPGAGTVLIMEGTNDIVKWRTNPKKFSPEISQATLQEMVDKVLAAGRVAVLATVLPRFADGIDPDNEETRSLNARIRTVAAATSGVLLADVYAAVEPALSEFIYDDSLHANALGYRLVAEPFAAAVTGVSADAVDLAGPLPISFDPEPGSAGAELESSIVFTLLELHGSVDRASLAMTVDGAPVVPSVEAAGRGAERFTYRLPELLEFGQRVSVAFTVSDTSTPARTTFYSYDFKATSGNGTAGDVDGSGRIDGADLAVVAVAFGAESGESRYRFEADIDGNGLVDGVDLAILSAGFGGAP